MVVIPRGLLASRAPSDGWTSAANGFSDDPDARREIERLAMESVMAAEQQLGNVPVDVSAQKVGYDIQSYDPERESLRFIEVKGRVAGADTGHGHASGGDNVVA